MSPQRALNIGPYAVGPGHPVFVIAEAGVNHNGDMDVARRLVDVAVEAGAQAVKFQTLFAERLVSADAPKARYALETTDAQESQFEMIRKLELGLEEHKLLQQYCRERGILFMSSPFDDESIDLLDGLDVPAFKVPSGEVVNLPYLRRMARKGRPIVLSTGMSTLAEVDEALRVIREEEGNEQVVVLHCVSNYPASASSVNLRAMLTMREALGVVTGFSDHTMGIEVPIAAAALGACVIEKHFTLDRNMPGPDHRASLEPDELKEMVRAIRSVESALGDGVKRPVEEELNTKEVARKSLHARRPLPEGHLIGPEDVIALRPGTGIPPSLTEVVVGRRLGQAVQAGQMLTWDMLR